MRLVYWIIPTLVVIVLVGWALFWQGGRPRVTVPSPRAAQVTHDLLTKPYAEHGENYDISAAYPTTTPMGEAGALLMQGWIIGEIGTFKDHIASSAHSSLTITYTASSTKTLASYFFTENVNGTLSTKTFTFTATTAP